MTQYGTKVCRHGFRLGTFADPFIAESQNRFFRIGLHFLSIRRMAPTMPKWHRGHGNFDCRRVTRRHKLPSGNTTHPEDPRVKHRELFCATLLLAIAPHAAQFNLAVDLSTTIRPATHCASGSLYGITEALPANVADHIAPLKPNVFVQPALSGSGHQQGVAAAAVPVAKKIASTTGKVQIRLADVLPGWPYNWPGQASFLASVKTVIQAKLASGLTNFDGYEIWNEPNDTWKSANGDFYTTCWKPTYDLIRSMDPKAKIIGPSYSYYNDNNMKAFLQSCKNGNALPDVVSWHQWGSGGFIGSFETYRNLEKTLGITPRAISINEYSSSTHTYEGSPGVSVPFIAKFERKQVESAMISWWFTGLPGRLGSLLTSKNEKGGGWWLYKWYGDMTGNMVSVTPPNDKSEGVDGFASVDQDQKYASIILGGNSIGTVNVTIKGFPAFFGSSVNVKYEYVTWTDKDSPVSGTTLVSTTKYDIVNGSITVPVNNTNQFHAYRLLVTPAASVGISRADAEAPGQESFRIYDHQGRNHGTATFVDGRPLRPTSGSPLQPGVYIARGLSGREPVTRTFVVGNP